MTVAAAIEIGTGGTHTPGLNKAQGAAQGSGLATVANQGLLQPIASGTESFRAGWQSLLASLGTGAEGFSETGAAGNQGTTSAEPALAEAAGKSSVSTSTPAAGADLRQETEKVTGPASAGLKLSQVDARTGASAARSITDVTKTASSRTEENKTSANREPESASGSRPTHSVKAAAPEVAAAASLPGLVTATVATFPQALPVAAVATQIAQGADSRTQSTHTETSADPFIDPPTEFASASFSSHPPNPERPNGVGGTASASVQEAVKGAEAPSEQGEASPVRSLSGSSGPTLGETEASTAGGGAAPAQEPLQPLTSSANLTKPLATSQAPPQTPALDQSEIPTQLGNRGANVLPVVMDSDGLNPLPIAANANAAPSGEHSAVSRIQGKPGTASEKKLSASDPLQSTRGTGKFDSAQHGNRIMQGQSSGAAVDASTTARAVAGAGGAASTAEGLAPRAPAATGGPDSREAFATLDAGGATGKPTWIHAGAQRAEAGFQDPALGWVGVRADMGGGGVHAELVAGSADAAQTLGGHLAGLNAYLAEHHTPVETLTLTSPDSGSSGLGSGKGSGDGMQQGTGHETGQGATQGADSREQFASSATPELPVWSVGRDGSAQTATQDGNHISVMA
jgi:hypothetical protein